MQDFCIIVGVVQSLSIYWCCISYWLMLLSNCRTAADRASTFEDIVDAYLAYLQVSFELSLSFCILSLFSNYNWGHQLIFGELASLTPALYKSIIIKIWLDDNIGRKIDPKNATCQYPVSKIIKNDVSICKLRFMQLLLFWIRSFIYMLC